MTDCALTDSGAVTEPALNDRGLARWSADGRAALADMADALENGATPAEAYAAMAESAAAAGHPMTAGPGRRSTGPPKPPAARPPPPPSWDGRPSRDGSPVSPS